MRARVETGTGYELLGAALSLTVDDTADARPSAAIEPQLADQIVRAGREPLVNAIGFLAGGAAGSSARQLVDGLRALDDGERRRVLLGYYRRSFRRATEPAIMDRAIAGDSTARAAFIHSSFPEIDHWQASLRLLLADDGPAQALRLVDALEALATTPAVGEAVAPAVDEAAERARQLLASSPVDLAIERLARPAGITFARAIGQEDVVINPRGSGPGILAVSDYGSTLVVSYPVEEAADMTPPGWLVSLGRALGDERRLRILRALATEPLAIADLAGRLGIPRTSLQYHLAILREAGLIGRAVDDAETGPLTLRRSGLDDIGLGLARYLGVVDGSTASGKGRRAAKTRSGSPTRS